MSGAIPLFPSYIPAWPGRGQIYLSDDDYDSNNNNNNK
jgi:hypothetical protein